MKHTLTAIFILSFISLTSCYYDNEAELYPSRTCTTTDIKYNTVIRPILNSNCSISGCHDATTLAGNYDLTTYTDVKRIADNGTFIGSISHAGGYVQMPKDRSKLADCQIAQIKTWIDDGALNN